MRYIESVQSQEMLVCVCVCVCVIFAVILMLVTRLPSVFRELMMQTTCGYLMIRNEIYQGTNPNEVINAFAQ